MIKDNNEKFESALKGLNKEQLEAVEAIEGPVAVVAGPGTGKTQILALRIGNILKKTQVDPYNILALTFTENGAIAMKKRLVSLIGPTGYDVQIFTFHSFCNKVIEEFPEKFAFKKELIPIEPITQHEIIREIINEFNFSHISSPTSKYANTYNILKHISDLKSEGSLPADLKDYLAVNMKDHLDNPPEESATKTVKAKYISRHKKLLKLEEFLLVYEKYEMKMKERSMYDFNDMILFVIDKFKVDEELLLYYQEKYQYILADEFQDTNNSQYKILDLLCSYFDENPNLFVVGDDDQSIYRFQGASIENFLGFFEKYPNCKKIVLKENYRSTQLILDASKSVIQNNTARIDESKSLHANFEFTESMIELNEFSVEAEELTYLVNSAKKLIEENVSPTEICFIARSNNQLKAIAAHFEKNSIPFSVSAGNNVLDNKYIKKIVALLKVLNDPTNFAEFNKFLFLPNLNVSVSEIMNFNKVVKDNKFENIFSIPVENKEGAISKLLRMADGWYKTFNLEPLPKAFMSMLMDLGLIEYLGLSFERLEDFESMNSFISFLNSLYHKDPSLDLSKLMFTLDSIFEHELRISEKESLSSQNSVQIMTAHKSKGLEFEYVFMPYCINSSWNESPKNNGSLIPDDLVRKIFDSKLDEEEEYRRLFYVALTRAKKKIFISYSMNYDDKNKTQMKSKFIEEIDPSLVMNVEREPLTQKELSEVLSKQIDTNYFELKEMNKIEDIVKNKFKLSVTSLNNFLACKKRFFLQNILNVPSEQKFIMIQGSLLHLLLEKFVSKKDLNWDEVGKVAESFVGKQILSKNDKEFLLSDSLDHFKKWYNYWTEKNELIVPLYSEYNCSNKGIYFDGIPLSGKIDVIEMLNENEKEVRVTDFKFKVPASGNSIKGLTADSTGDMYRQLMFYKLILESDPNFKFEVAQGAIAFLKENDSGYMKTEYISYNEQDYAEFKQLVMDTYQSILNLEFLDFSEKCNCKKCDYSYL